MSDLPAGADNGSDAGPAGEARSRPGTRRPWLGRLSTYIVSLAGGLTIDDLSGRLGYRWLPGAVALAGVVTAAFWLRRLDSRGRVARYASPVFLLLAGCAAGVAAFNPRSTAGISTVAAAVLTVGAVWLTKELQSAARLLFGSVAIALGTPFFVFGAVSIVGPDALDGAALIVGGASPIVFGAAVIAGRAMLARAAVIAGGAVVIAVGTGIIAARHAQAGEAVIALGAAAVVSGAAFVAGRAILAGAAVTAVGVAFIAFGLALTVAGADFIAHPVVLTGAAVSLLGAVVIAFQGTVHRVRASIRRRPPAG